MKNPIQDLRFPHQLYTFSSLRSLSARVWAYTFKPKSCRPKQAPDNPYSSLLGSFFWYDPKPQTLTQALFAPSFGMAIGLTSGFLSKGTLATSASWPGRWPSAAAPRPVAPVEQGCLGPAMKERIAILCENSMSQALLKGGLYRIIHRVLISGLSKAAHKEL